MLTISDKELKMWFAGISVNYRKCLQAYFVKNDIEFDQLDKYLAEYTEEEFFTKLKEFYIITGDITPNKILRAKKKEGYIPTEYDEQKRLCQWLRANKIKHAASGNGYKLATENNIHYISKLKATGLCVGFPDIQVFVGNGKTLFIEMKRTKNYSVSDEQIKWIEWLNNNGYIAKICYGANEAINFIKNYLQI